MDLIPLTLEAGYILTCLLVKPHSTGELRKALMGISIDGATLFARGNLSYRLRRLKELGLIQPLTSPIGKGRKRYELSDLGRTTLATDYRRLVYSLTELEYHLYGGGNHYADV